MSVAWQCEIDPYCRAVLAHHWPGVKCYDDIRAIDDTAERVDLICGGFPCQPVSLAGKGLAQEDPRWLWPEFARVVGLLRPRYVLVENVPGLVKRGLDIVVTGLAEMGYDAEWEIVSAAACGAPHLRERIFVVAYPGRGGPLADSGCLSGSTRGDARNLARPSGALEGVGKEWQWGRDAADDRGADVADADGYGREGVAEPHREAQPGGEASEQRHDADGLRDALADPDGPTWVGSRPTGEAVFRPEAIERLGRRSCGDGSQWSVEPDVGRVAHGVPNRLAQLRALGNAVVPQVAEFVGRLILEAEGAQLAA